MTVVKVQETWESREGSVNIKGQLSARRSFRVIVDASRTTIPDVLTGVDPDTGEYIPTVGSPHNEDFSLYCSGLTPVQRNKMLWEVIAEYSNENSSAAEDPLDDAAVIEWESEQFQRPTFVDRDGNGIINTAGDFPDPPPEMDDSRRVVIIRKNLASVPSWILDYQDTINDAVFTVDGVSVGQGLAKVQRVAVGSLQRRNNTYFRQVTLVFHLRRDGWQLQTPNAGFRYKSGSLRVQIAFDDSGNLVAPWSANANLPMQPVPLDASGAVLTNPTAATVTFITSDVYEERNFSALPLS